MKVKDALNTSPADALAAAFPWDDPATHQSASSSDAQLSEPSSVQAPVWVPIRKLGRRHHHLVSQHLMALVPADRQLRFGHAASDSMLQRYLQSLNYDSDAIFGVFNRRLQLVALAHLALFSSAEQGLAAVGEFGVSVSPSARRRGLGARLFEHSVIHARNRGVSQLVIHIAADNKAMLRIVHKAGSQLHHMGNEVEARLDLRDASWSSRIEALVDEEAAKADFRIKLHLHKLDQLWN